MDQRAKKLERARKKREQAKNKARALAARKPSEMELLVRSAARGEFGPCFISAEWDDLEVPALVSVIVTRRVAGGQLVPGVALVDRACLGVKNGFVKAAMFGGELAEFVDQVGSRGAGMLTCELLLAQSVVFHAIDYARSLGFEPHPDFPSALFGPRPEQLLDTPWHAPERPIYVAGPYDNVRAIQSRLIKAVGASGFEYIDVAALPDDDDDDDDAEDDELISSQLECTVSRDGIALRILIYRGSAEATWHLEVEDPEGGSTVWDERFDTDQAALDAAMLAIEEDGIESFVAGAPVAARLRPHST